MILLNFLLLIVGFGLLIYGADTMIKGASSIAKKAGLSELFIGLTVVAFGTSLPEMVSNVFAVMRGSFDLAIGAVIGSNISNVLLVLGIAALIYPLAVRKSTIHREVPYNFLAIGILFLVANDVFFGNSPMSFISRVDGIILIVIFGLFIYHTFVSGKVSGQDSEEMKTKRYPYSTSTALVVGGIFMLTLGGHFVVSSAVTLATFFGWSEALIGLTIVALGTSLPELATSATAAYKKNSDIAIGNIIGSNVFNIFLVLGISALIRPMNFSGILNYDLLIFLFVMFLLVAFMYVGKRNILQRWQGATMISLYAVYIVYLVLRG